MCVCVCVCVCVTTLANQSLNSVVCQFSFPQVKETEEKLRLWSLEVADLQSHYKYLLFFSIPKLLILHKSMRENQVEEIVNEISFLFKNNTIVRGKLKSNVKVGCKYLCLIRCIFLNN